MINIAARLGSMGMKMDKSFLVTFIMNSLPPQYGPFQINYNTIKMECDRITNFAYSRRITTEEARNSLN